MKKLSKKTLGIGLGLVIIIGVAAIPGMKTSPEPLVDITELSKGELVNSINVSGIVQSNEAHSIYAKENLVVEEVRVEVGDTVKTGDVLAVLDTSSVKKDLEKAQVNKESSLVSKANDEEAIQNNIASAKKSLEGARLTLEKQKLNYETIKQEYEAGTNIEITNAKGALERAEMELTTSKKNYENGKVLFEQGFIAQTEYDSYETAYNNALINHTNAKESYDKAVENLEKSYKQAGLDLEVAQNSYEAAQVSLESAEQKNTQSYTYSIQQQDIEMSKMQDKIANAIITAPADGVVTAKNIEVGQMPSGILFEIENMDQLVVTTYIKEYDIANIVLGQEVILKSDGTGDKTIKGIVSYIAPTTRKDTVGTNEFEVEVQVTDKESGLKVGMEARMNIILEQQADIFYVSYDALLTNEQGEDAIYIVEDGKVKEVPVEVGMESDVYIEVKALDLQEGIKVISNPSNYVPGEKVKVE